MSFSFKFIFIELLDTLLLKDLLLFCGLFNSLYKVLQNELLFRITNDLANEAQRLLNRENDNCSTDNDENNSNNISFDEENDENIIVENSEVIYVDLNIKDYDENAKKSKLD